MESGSFFSVPVRVFIALDIYEKGKFRVAGTSTGGRRFKGRAATIETDGTLLAPNDRKGHR